MSLAFFATSLLPYVGIALSLVAAGSFVPFPEEIILLTLGYGASAHVVHVLPALIAAILGIMIGDNMLFFLARQGGDYVDALYARLTQSRAGKFIAKGDSYPGYLVFVTRFIIGVRTVGPFIAVNQGMKWSRFFFWDTLAILIYTPLWFFLGFHFHHSILRIIEDMDIAKHIIFGLALLVFFAGVAWCAYGRVGSVFSEK